MVSWASFLGYYKQFWIQVFRDMYDSWISQVVGIILSVLIVFAQWYFGVFTRNLTKANVLSVLYPYLILFFLFFLFHIVRAPVKLDKMLQDRLVGKTKELESYQLNPLEQERHSLVASKIAELNPSGVRAVRKILVTGEMHGAFAGDGEPVSDQLIKAVSLNLLSSRYDANGRYFSINPDLRSAIEHYFKLRNKPR